MQNGPSASAPTPSQDSAAALPDQLESFEGWCEDPTDEEVAALIRARDDFSCDHS